MDPREAIRLAALRLEEESDVVKTAAPVEEEPEEELGELQVSEYIIFLLAVDTYIRYLEETTGKEDPEDAVVVKGMRLLRQAEGDLEKLRAFLSSHIKTPVHQKLLDRALAMRVTTVMGIGRRAFQMRTLLSRGGAPTMRAIFDTNRARKQVKEATNAAMLDDGDAALDIFAAIPLRNVRLAAWIDLAAKTAGSGEVFLNPTEAGMQEAMDQAPALVEAALQESTASAEDSRAALDDKSDRLYQMQADAQAAAKKALDKSGEPDLPLTRSETVGVAVAAATAVVTDTSNPRNIPETLRDLDDDQRVAALTNGRTVVFAGAGSGKSFTIVQRVAYLIKEKKANPTRILVTSFNTNSSDELADKIAKQVGDAAVGQMSTGTMHSLFKGIIKRYGTEDEKLAVGAVQGESANFQGDGSSIHRVIQSVWEEENRIIGNTGTPEEKEQLKQMPPYKAVSSFIARWLGSDVTPDEALAGALDQEEKLAAEWYRRYLAIKDRSYKPKIPSQAWDRFQATRGLGSGPIGDFTDQLKIARDLLKRNPIVLKQVAQMYQHIIVDEAQDMNPLMAEIVELIGKDVPKDPKSDKSLWVVGDVRQSINSFQGARADRMAALFDNPDWNTRTIKTNYRCEPEIVEAGNKLISFNPEAKMFSQNADPKRPPKNGSIRVSAPKDEDTAAYNVITAVKSSEDPLTDHAVLCRTKRELNAYETACIWKGVPYARRGKGSPIFGSPETAAMLGYVQLITGTDFRKMQKSLGLALGMPNRFYVAAEKLQAATEEALNAYARRTGKDLGSINPMAAMRDQPFRNALVDSILRAKGKSTNDKSARAFLRTLEDLSGDLDLIKADYSASLKSENESDRFTTKDLFDNVLQLPCRSLVDGEWVESTFRESLGRDIESKISAASDEDVDLEEDDDLPNTMSKIGSISYLYDMAKTDPEDEDDRVNPPHLPEGFAAKMARFMSKARELRIDVAEWNKKQQNLPANKRTPPPGLYLGTVHSTKGAQWKNVHLQMPRGVFPMTRPKKPDDEEEQDPVVIEARMEREEKRMEDERRLGYVAVTRAIKNLSIICPLELDGRMGGVSRYVEDAGLHMGENVVPEGVEDVNGLNDEGTDRVKTAHEVDIAPEFIWTASQDIPWDPNGEV